MWRRYLWYFPIIWCRRYSYCPTCSLDFHRRIFGSPRSALKRCKWAFKVPFGNAKTWFSSEKKIFVDSLRLPFDGLSVCGFAIAIILTTFIFAADGMSILSFLTIYIGICFNIKSFIDDISSTVSRLNEKIDQKATIRCELKHLVEFHIDYYRWEQSKRSLLFFRTTFWTDFKTFTWISMTCNMDFLCLESWACWKTSFEHRFSFKSPFLAYNWPLYCFNWRM